MRQIADVNHRPATFEEGVESVLYLRCMDHRAVPQLNEKEGNGGECPICEIAELRSRLQEAEKKS